MVRFFLSSMKSIIERYNKHREEHQNRLFNSSSEVKFWQREASSLRQQLQYVQQCNRQLMGHELSGLSIKDLRNLESQLDMSLRCIRMRKDQVLSDEIEKLKRKVCGASDAEANNGSDSHAIEAQPLNKVAIALTEKDDCLSLSPNHLLEM
ncbi:hypothetical protein L6164_032667 [Bauhinia variegata]|uniref:Uncharacterized protein n=1 Tax=Bauhinia variegata TaxID=167791 RepID=A0ACB9KPE8_BAUVA|nr:hypothetical protein L6164_032667 [Bauhinia variegata]